MNILLSCQYIKIHSDVSTYISWNQFRKIALMKEHKLQVLENKALSNMMEDTGR
jgi:hypothetical protein